MIAKVTRHKERRLAHCHQNNQYKQIYKKLCAKRYYAAELLPELHSLFYFQFYGPDVLLCYFQHIWRRLKLQKDVPEARQSATLGNFSYTQDEISSHCLTNLQYHHLPSLQRIHAQPKQQQQRKSKIKIKLILYLKTRQKLRQQISTKLPEFWL